MKKVMTLICLLTITTGVTNARPIAPQHNFNRQSAPIPKVALPPKPMPVAQVPVVVPVYNNYGYGYNNSPYVTFSLGNVDVTLGL